MNRMGFLLISRLSNLENDVAKENKHYLQLGIFVPDMKLQDFEVTQKDLRASLSPRCIQPMHIGYSKWYKMCDIVMYTYLPN